MAEIKTGDKMFLTSQYEQLVEVIVTKVTENRIYFSGSHFYTFINKRPWGQMRIHKTKQDAKAHLIKPLQFRINNYQEEIERIESL